MNLRRFSLLMVSDTGAPFCQKPRRTRRHFSCHCPERASCSQEIPRDLSQGRSHEAERTPPGSLEVIKTEHVDNPS